MLEISEIACPRILTRAVLLGRVMITSDFYDSGGESEAHCSEKASSAMTAASMLVWDDVEGV